MTHLRRPFSEAIPLCASGEGPVSDTMAEVDCGLCIRAFLNARDQLLREQHRRAFHKPKKFR